MDRHVVMGMIVVAGAVLILSGLGDKCRAQDNISGVTAPAARGVQKLTLKVVKVDSEETVAEDGRGANAVDGNPSTFWHTQWQDASPTHPHEIILQLDPPCKIKGLT